METISFVGFTSKKRYGVELEMNRHLTQVQIKALIRAADPLREIAVTSWGHTRNNNYWHIKTDSTCGDKGHGKDDGGWEVASFVARGYSDLKAIGEVVRALKMSGAQVNQNCGLHVHCDVGSSGTTEIYQLIKYWVKIENILYQIVPENRRNNIYCIPLRQKLKLSQSAILGDITLSHRIDDCIHDYNDRRTSFNVWNYFHGDIPTVELRLPEGTVNENTVKHWVRLFVNFCSNNMPAIENVSPANLKDTLNILGLQGDKKFYILSKPLLSTKIWFLKRILKHSTDLLLKNEAKSILLDII